jgi:hypothetical protein
VHLRSLKAKAGPPRKKPIELAVGRRRIVKKLRDELIVGEAARVVSSRFGGVGDGGTW